MVRCKIIMKEKAGDKMVLTVFQQKFKNALLNITDNIVTHFR